MTYDNWKLDYPESYDDDGEHSANCHCEACCEASWDEETERSMVILRRMGHVD